MKFPFTKPRRDPVEVYETLAPVFHGMRGPGFEWRFRVKGANGEIVASSESYTTKADAERGAATLKRLMRDHK